MPVPEVLRRLSQAGIPRVAQRGTQTVTWLKRNISTDCGFSLANASHSQSPTSNSQPLHANSGSWGLEFGIWELT